MTIQNRDVSIKGVFAADAYTDIPQTPVTGISYRDTSLTAQEVRQGWPYKEIVDSAKYNQHLFEVTSVAKLFETYGFLPWSQNTDYEQGSVCLGTDGKLYQAKQNTGPSSTAYNPVNDTSSTYWNVAFARVPDTNVWTALNTFNGGLAATGNVTMVNATQVTVPTSSDTNSTTSTNAANCGWVNTRVNNVLNAKFQIVNSLPTNPDTDTFYFIVG